TVINDDIGYSNSPFFNDGITAQQVDAVVAQGVFYASAAGNVGNEGWQAPWRALATTVAGVSGTFEDVGNGTPLQTFTLPNGSSTSLSFQWDSAFLEGGSFQPIFHVPNDVEVLVTDAAGTRVLQRFN